MSARLMCATAITLLSSCFSLRQLAPDVPLGCGNGKVEAPESCDPAAPLTPRACVLRAEGPGGAVSGCTDQCELELGTCVTPADERVSLWLSGEAEDAAGTLVDHREPSTPIVFQRDGVTRAPDVLTLSTAVAVPRTFQALDARAHDFALGTGHSVFIASDISAATPITYELWISLQTTTPDREGVIFQHENGCTLAVQPGLRLRATCGDATVDSPAPLARDTYAFVVVEVAKATLTLRVGSASVSAPNAPISIERGRFAIANTLTPADGATKQFVGRIDDLRIFSAARSPADLCADRGSDSCD